MGVPLSAVHSAQVWLPLTQTWLHDQVHYLPPEVRSAVACDRREGDWKVRADKILRRTLLDRVRRIPPAKARSDALARFARRQKADLVHSHFGNVGWGDLGAVRAAGTRHVVSFYGQDLTRYPTIAPVWAERYRALLDSGAHILCEGPHMASVARKFGGASARIHVHHLGVDVARIPFQPRSWRPGTPLKVLMAASFREKKGLPDAIRALGRLAQEVPVEATLIGDAEPGRGPSQEEKARIEAAIAEANLPSLRRLGFVDRATLQREAAAHHVFLSPSRTAGDGDTEGGAPVALIEMAAGGMPVVTTKHCDIPHVLPKEYAPLLSPEGDVAALHRALRRLVDAPESWSPLLQAARRRIEAEYDVRTQGRRLAALYREVVA